MFSAPYFRSKYEYHFRLKCSCTKTIHSVGSSDAMFLLCIFFLTGEIVGTLTTDGKSPVIQYQTKTIRTMITFRCNHLGQVSGVSVL